MKIKKAAFFKWLILTSVLLLSVVTGFALTKVDRFYVQTEQMLMDPYFHQGEKYWGRTGSQLVDFQGKQLNLVNDQNKSQSVSQNVVIEAPASVRFSFEGSSRDIVVSDKEWAGASGTVIFRNEAGERLGSKTIVSMVGSKKSKTYSSRVVLREVISSIDISFRLLAAGGTFSVKNPVLSLLVEFPFYKKLKFFITGVWICVFLALGYLGLRALSGLQLVCLFLLGTVTLGGALMPESLMSLINAKLAGGAPEAMLSSTKNVLAKVFGINKLAGPGAEISKLGHFATFTLIGFLVGWFWKRIGLVFGVACVSVFALLSETLQLLVEGRTPSSGDLVIDISGGLVGIALGVLGLYIYGIFSSIDKPLHQDYKN